MQIFITDNNLTSSAQSLDDIRLSKNITEINQILLTYINHEFDVAHKNHPVNMHYKSRSGIHFLLNYLSVLCNEYEMRFGKCHMGKITQIGMYKWFIEQNIIFQYDLGKVFAVAYIQGVDGKNNILTTDNVFDIYTYLIIDNWNEDNLNTTCTN